MVYQSFNNSTNKIQKNWERSEENENDLKKVPFITLDFNSINFNKKITTIPILTNEEAGVLSDIPQTVLLENFPEWALNMIEPFVTYTIEDGFATKFIPTTLQQAFDNGTLKDDDVSIEIQEFHYWFNHIDQTNFLLKVFYTINIREAILRESGFTSTRIPAFINISLKILNHRIYEVMNEKKN